MTGFYMKFNIDWNGLNGSTEGRWTLLINTNLYKIHDFCVSLDYFYVVITASLFRL